MATVSFAGPGISTTADIDPIEIALVDEDDPRGNMISRAFFCVSARWIFDGLGSAG
jgi:hypothetical protein